MKRILGALLVAGLSFAAGCGDDDDDRAADKKPLALDKVPSAVMEAAKKAQPDLTFFAAAEDTFEGKPSIELKGRTKSGQIKEVEVSPDGKVLGIE